MAFIALQKTVCLTALVLTLAGCETMSTRNCPAFEGTPESRSWATYSVGDSLMYVSDKGRSENYILRSIESNDAYDETDFGETEDIRCRETITYLFESSGADHYLHQSFTIINKVGVPMEERPLYVELTAIETSDASTNNYERLRFQLNDIAYTAAGNDSTAEAEVTYSATREVGQVTYQDVFEMRTRDTAINFNLPPETTLTRAVFARNAGLVEFERSDEESFTLTQP